MVKKTPQPTATSMSLEDVATFLKISEKTVKELIAEGYLSALASTSNAKSSAIQFSRAAVAKLQKMLPQLADRSAKSVVTKKNSLNLSSRIGKTVTAASEDLELIRSSAPLTKDITDRTENRAENDPVINDHSISESVISRRKAISAVEAAAKLILTLEEAAVLTHIPAGELRRELKMGRLRGLIRGRGWKIHRSHLDEYVANLYVPKKRLDSFKE
jgi:excisionase family DNA binding protein